LHAPGKGEKGDVSRTKPGAHSSGRSSGTHLPASALNALPVAPFLFEPLAGARQRCARPLPPFSRARLCAALRGRGILLLGDSLTAGLHDALLELLGGARTRFEEPNGTHCAHRSLDWPGSPCEGHLLCGGDSGGPPATLRLRRNDYLLLNISDPRVESHFLKQRRRGRGWEVNRAYAAGAMACSKRRIAAAAERGFGCHDFRLPVEDVMPSAAVVVMKSPAPRRPPAPLRRPRATAATGSRWSRWLHA